MVKIVKLLFIIVLLSIAYFIGWGQGQSDTYEKIKTTPSLMEEFYGK
jgi:hypothetical protein